MKTWVISDTHCMHEQLKVPDVECVIHAGDSTNTYNLIQNQNEFEPFLQWFKNLPIKHKILIAGNHDAWATKKYNIDLVKDSGIIYLENEYYEINNKVFYGSPITPIFYNWYFMVNRAKIHKYWEHLENIDVLITHGPPKGILDLSHDKNHNLEYCGDNALLKTVERIKPAYHIFGHIHDSKGCYNSGIKQISGLPTTFINASCVTDGRFDYGLTSQGQIIEI